MMFPELPPPDDKQKKRLLEKCLKEKRKIYNNLVNLTLFIKKEISPKIEKIFPPPSEILDLKIKMTEFFRKEIFTEHCRRCNELAGCCCRHLYLATSDIVYFSIVNKKYYLPAPDWSFLRTKTTIFRSDQVTKGEIRSNWEAKIAGDGCIFLGVEGCILGNKKPQVCLTHICGRLREIIITNQYKYFISENDRLRALWYEWLKKINSKIRNQIGHYPIISATHNVMHLELEEIKKMMTEEITAVN